MFEPMDYYANNEAFDGLFDKVKKVAKKAANSKIVRVQSAIMTVGLSEVARSKKVQKATKQLGYKLDKTVGGAQGWSKLTGALAPVAAAIPIVGTAASAGLITASAVTKAAAQTQAEKKKEKQAAKAATQKAEAEIQIMREAAGLPALSPSAAAGDAALAQTMSIAAGGAEIPVATDTTGTPTTPVDAVQSAVASAAAGAPKKSAAPALGIAAGAGAGFLVFGPIGAVAGAAAGAFLGRKKA